MSSKERHGSTIAMARKAPRRSKKSIIRKLRTTLTQVAELSPQALFVDGDTYICAFCNLPIKVCERKPTAFCKSKLHDGTILQLLNDANRSSSRLCLLCGGPIPQKILKKKPLAEICSLCAQRAVHIRTTKRSKGVLL